MIFSSFQYFGYRFSKIFLSAVIVLISFIFFSLSSTFALTTNDPRLIGQDPNNWQQWGLQKIDAAGGWDTTQGSSDIKIAIIDTGINESHEDLVGKVVDRANFSCDPDTNDWGGLSGTGHGTKVAGIAAAATDNSIGIAGMGFNTSLLNVKITGANCQSASSDTIRQAVDWSVSAGADVINISFSAGFGVLGYDPALDAAIQNAWNQGIVIVAAAGNDDSSYSRYPAAYNNVISVGATDQNDAKVAGTNYGSWVRVAAPGFNIDTPCSAGTNVYCSFNDTSAAAPFVSGLAALIIARHAGEPGFDQADVKDLIESTTDIIPGTGSYWLKGRINACRALGGGGNCMLLKVIDPNLVGHWKMDETNWVNDCVNADVIDSSGSNYDGKTCPALVSNGPNTTNLGKYGSAGSFDGVNDYVDTGLSPNLNITGPMTISAWVNPVSLANGSPVVIRTSGTGSITYLLGVDGSGSAYFQTKNAPVYGMDYNHYVGVNSAANSVVPGVWTHIAGVYDGPTLKMYINGNLVDTDALGFTPPSNPNSPTQIGDSTGDGFWNQFKGKIDEVRIYNRALSGGEIAQIQDPLTATATNLVGYWMMDENAWVGNCSTLTAVDSSSSGYSGKACPAGSGGPTLTGGKFNSAGNFDGSNDNITISNSTNLNMTGQMTVSAWVNPVTMANVTPVVIRTSGSSYINYLLAYNAAGSAAFNIKNGQYNNLAAGSAAGLVTAGNWSHLVGTYNGTHLKIYVNGVLRNTVAIGFTPPSLPTVATQIGDSTYDSFWNIVRGKVDDVRIYDRALSDTEVTSLYNSVP